jgi:hypothetical protein
MKNRKFGFNIFTVPGRNFYFFNEKKEISEEQIVEGNFKPNLYYRFHTKIQCFGSRSESGRIRIIFEAGSGSALE